jgi:hypothetical protein
VIVWLATVQLGAVVVVVVVLTAVQLMVTSPELVHWKDVGDEEQICTLLTVTDCAFAAGITANKPAAARAAIAPRVKNSIRFMSRRSSRGLPLSRALPLVIERPFCPVLVPVRGSRLYLKKRLIPREDYSTIVAVSTEFPLIFTTCETLAK